MSRKKPAERERFLEEGRALILENADALFHALGCDECGLRFQALLSLALVGWSEAEFVTAEMEARADVSEV